MAVSLSIGITQNSQDVASNTSNVTVTVTATWTNGSYNQLQKPGSLIIDGTTYSFTSYFNYNSTTSGSQVLFTKTVNVTHSIDGTKTLSCSSTYNTGVSSGIISANASKTLTTIATAAELSVSNGVLGEEQVLYVTGDRLGFTYTIIATCGSLKETICTKDDAVYYSFTPPLSWGSGVTSSRVSVTYKISTYSGSSLIGTKSYVRTCEVPESSVDVSISISDDMGYFETYKKYIQGKSRLNININANSDSNYDITTYNTSFDGKIYNSKSFITEVISGSGRLSVVVGAVDEQGNSGSATETISVLPYNTPVITDLKIERCDSNGTRNTSGTYMAVTFSSKVSELDNFNSAIYDITITEISSDGIKVSYTPSDLSTYLSGLTGQYNLNEEYIFNTSGLSYKYEITVSVRDNFTTNTSFNDGSSNTKFFSFLKGGLGIALGKIASIAGLEVDWTTKFNKTVSIDGKLTTNGGISTKTITSNEYIDSYGQKIQNGVASYLSSGIDPNTTLDHLIITNHSNAPVSGTFFYIHTLFYQTKTVSANRAQYAIPYSSNGSMYHRYYYNNSWSAWRRHVNEDESGSSGLLIQQGTLPVKYSNSNQSTQCYFDIPFNTPDDGGTPPVVILQQNFNEVNITVTGTSDEGFTITVPAISGTSGTNYRDVGYIAVGGK